MKLSSVSSYLLVILLSAITFGAKAQPGPTPSKQPNVVLIFADDLGWGDLSCYGEKRFSTPQMDRLAKEGAKLTDFYSTAPYCAPSRASLLTGRYQFRSNMMRNPSPDSGVNDVGIPDSEITLGEAFQKAGYQTACIGKWHLGHKPEFHPLRHGFHEYLGILYSHDMRPVELLDGTNVVEYPVVLPNLTKKYTARALEFIEKNRDKPFFLYIPHALPHKPLAASEELYKTSGAGLYGDTMLEVDRSVGAVLNKLD
ncbi:MAG: sulfatase-like hydrolase/transferase, partial [Limisphaerales bacterium]